MRVWLDSLRADFVFGWRQILKRKVTSAAAILSLGLGIGACAAAFRLIDALLLRPLPVSGAERLYLVARQGLGPFGDSRVSDSCEYPLFQRMRSALQDRADLIAVSYADTVDITYSSDSEIEKAYRQYVSGSMFPSFGLNPALGRLLSASDDRTPQAHPVTVISHHYWTRRLGRDPSVLGRKVRIGNDLLEIIGVAPAGFGGTEPGTIVDFFIPTMMNPYVTRSDASWFRALVLLKPGIPAEPLRQQLHMMTRAFSEERARPWTSQTKQFIDRFLNQTVLLLPAASGVSGMQTSYQTSLAVLGVLVALVLLIACLNVANLKTAEAAARSKEMALRISIGAGSSRLVQLVLAESACLSILAAAVGCLFAWWAAPFVVSRINPPDRPARLFLELDWRVILFSIVLTFLVTFLFGLIPALRTSSIKPASALRNGDAHSARRMMYLAVAAQVAFCFIIHFAAGLFVTTLDRVAHQPTGFNAERLLAMEVAARSSHSTTAWDQVADRLRSVPGVERVAMSEWPLLRGTGRNGFIWVNGTPTGIGSYFLAVSPGFIGTMGIRSLDGRDLRPTDLQPGMAVVNEAFVRQCFSGQNPLGRFFEKETGNGVTRDRYQVVGVVGDARYRNMREPITPTAYIPFHEVNSAGEPLPKASATFLVRTLQQNPMAVASALRQEVSKAGADLRITNIRTQVELVEQHTVRERLLAMLAVFFSALALLLAAIGLYGVLEYCVIQRRRELAIRMAIGANILDIARRVVREVSAMVLAGSILGMALSIILIRYVATLLYQTKPTELHILTVPAITILSASFLAALPAVFRAIRINPNTTLRSD